MSLNLIFFNSFGRLRSGWRFAVFAALFFLAALILAAMANSVAVLLGAESAAFWRSREGFAVSTGLTLLAAVVIGAICAKGIEGLPLRSLGWSLNGRAASDLLLGLLFGAGSLLAAAGIAYCGGGLQFVFNPAGTASIAETVLLSAVVFAFGAAGEEALFRGYPLQTFARARLVWMAVLLTSVFFALGHAGNDNVDYFGLANTVLAGVWFVAAYLKTRTLWFPFAMHWAWNWTMAAILGLPVSGINSITPNPIWHGVDLGPSWLTGGKYGLEAGVACTIALFGSTILIWFAPFLRPTTEMLALTDKENAAAQNEQPLQIFDNDLP